MSAPDLRIVLLDALEDERKAEATYEAVIAKFGPIRPFINIVEAEQRHAAALERQMQRLGMEVPENRWDAGKIAPSASLADACAMAIEAEIENIALYDRLIPQIDDPTVRQVLQSLQDASRNNHLPAFRRCLARETGQSSGTGGGRGQGGRRHRGGCRS
jgi:rubrerythrin